jgi:hypothetical protein
VAVTYYTLDNDPTPHAYTGPVTLTDPGYHHLNFWSVDNAGNVEAHNDAAHTVWMLTTTGPAVEANLDGLAPGATVAFVDDTTSTTTAMAAQSDGGYLATEYLNLDPGTTPALSYHYVINGVPTAEFTHTLTPAETEAALVPIADTITLQYTGDASGDFHDPAAVSAALAVSGTPLKGAPLTFTLGTDTCQATTDTTGHAGCSLTPTAPTGTATLDITMSAQSHTAVDTTTPFTITAEEDSVTYAGPASVTAGQAATLSADLTEDGTIPVAGRALTFTLGTGPGSQTCTTPAPTDSTGAASCTLTTISQSPTTTEPLTVAFAGDNNYRPTTAPTTVAVVAQLDHLVVTPAATTTPAGTDVTFKADGVDGAGRDIGDVTTATTFTITPDGTCTAATCTATTAGAHTITGLDSGATGSASLIVTPGSLDHLDLNPPNATSVYGTTQTFGATGIDRFGNTTGDVTTATTFSISPDGTCRASTCTPGAAGTHQVMATDGTATGTSALQVTPAPLIVIAPSPTVSYGSPPPTLPASYQGFVAGDGPESLSSPASCLTTATTTSPPGAYPVTCSGAADANYTFTYQPGTLAVTPAPTTLRVSPSANPTTPGTTITFTASVAPVPDGGSVSFADGANGISGCVAQPIDSSGRATCTTALNVLGDHTISAAYSGDARYRSSTTTLTQTVAYGEFNLIALDTTVCKAFSSTGNNVNLNLGSGGMFVTSNCTAPASGAWYQSGSSFSLNPTATVDVVGSFNGGGHYSGPGPHTGVPSPSHRGDPLWNLAPPAPPTSPTVMGSGASTLCPQGQGTFVPGVYNCQIRLTGPATFNAGDYSITGGITDAANSATVSIGGAAKPSHITLGGVGFVNIASRASINATATIFSITAGQWNFQGNSCICTTTPPSTDTTAASYDPIYGGITLFQSRTDPSPITFAGNQNGSNISGVIYAPDAPFLITANSTTVSALSVIADAISVTASGSFTSDSPGYWVRA